MIGMPMGQIVRMQVRRTARYHLKYIFCSLVLCGLIIFSCQFLLYEFATSGGINARRTDPGRSPPNTKNEKVFIASVICGRSHFEEAMVMMKSAIAFRGRSELTLVVVCEKALQEDLKIRLEFMQAMVRNSFSFQIVDLWYPEGRRVRWTKLDRPCGTERLFLPTILPNISKVLYVDTDILFMNELSEVWRPMHSMNATQMAGMIHANEDPKLSYYATKSQSPYYGELGLNSGVIFMDLERMRHFSWLSFMEPIYIKFRDVMPRGDQDILNAFFHFFPETMLLCSCIYNFHPGSCEVRYVCPDAYVHGISMIHGWNSVFHKKEEDRAAFWMVYDTFAEYDLGTDPYIYLVEPLTKRLRQVVHTKCGKMLDVFLRHFVRVFGNSKK